MNTSDFKEASERYKQEMLDLYGTKMQPRQVPEPEDQEEFKKETEKTEKKESEVLDESRIEEKFPPPVIPDFIRAESSERENDSFGFLKVSVKTGSGGIPIENSAVTVSQTVDGEEKIIKLMLTNSSGDTDTIKLPAPKKPPGNQPEDFGHYSTYNISAFSEGYFRAESLNAPIFEGITSIQTFFLVPEPYNYDSNQDTMNYRNDEPIV